MSGNGGNSISNVNEDQMNRFFNNGEGKLEATFERKTTEDGNTGGGASLWGGSANADKGSTKQVEERGSFKMEWTNNSNQKK